MKIVIEQKRITSRYVNINCVLILSHTLNLCEHAFYLLLLDQNQEAQGHADSQPESIDQGIHLVPHNVAKRHFQMILNLFFPSFFTYLRSNDHLTYNTIRYYHV
jgi:hypothetical protein